MLFNSQRATVAQWRGGPSQCAYCGGELLARKGEIVVWHWAHRPRRHDRKACPWAESPWHLRWKKAYLDFPEWEVEKVITTPLGRFVVDAMNPRTGRIREFVHSLSPSYIEKHTALKRLGLDVMWLWHGDRFISRRHHLTQAGDGLRDLLTPRAAEVHAAIGGSVHLDGQLWMLKEQYRTWYPLAGPHAKAVLAAYEAAG